MRSRYADMQVFDNINKTVKDDLVITIERGCKLSIASACFSIYAYQALKKQLDGIDELRFIFTSPAFVTEKYQKEKREFYIPRLNRERSLYGTDYLYDNVSVFVKNKFALDTAMVTGSVDGKTTIRQFRATLSNVLTCFSPLSKEKHLLMPDDNSEITVLIGTDCISEGQNLQDCDYCVNYDIHWNPVSIIQRFGRIDRIGSKNAHIQLVNFWPNVTLDEYINLKSRVETRMKISVMTATGDDDLINAEEKGDLEYRKAQLERLQNEIVDIEEMQSGISIMDLGLNDFRLDLLGYIKNNDGLDKTPFGLHAIVPSSDDYPPGVIFILKNRSGGVNINNRNRLHPFYMVYINDSGEIVCDHLSPKEILDTMRLLCKGRTAPLFDLCRVFNTETRGGKNMRKYSELLGGAITSIIDVKAKSDIDSFLSGETVNFISSSISGLDDFELICFLVVQ